MIIRRFQYRVHSSGYTLVCDGCGKLLVDRFYCCDCGMDLCPSCSGQKELPPPHQADHSVLHLEMPRQLPPERFHRELWSYLALVEQKIERQGGVPSFFDNFIRMTASDVGMTEKGVGNGAAASQDIQDRLSYLQEVVFRHQQGRFVSYFDRIRTPGSDIPMPVTSMSQGVRDTLQWKGMPLFKTVFDTAIYSMLFWELRPGTIIELGSGTGASAIWMQDICASMGLAQPRILSVDLKAPDLKYAGVSFIQGDCNRIQDALPPSILSTLPRPWLLIEDAHENVRGVLEYFDEHLREGDYVVVEDSGDKQDAIAGFLAQRDDSYRVDSHYVDFFGHNATCCTDSILRKGRG